MLGFEAINANKATKQAPAENPLKVNFFLSPPNSSICLLIHLSASHKS